MVADFGGDVILPGTPGWMIPDTERLVMTAAGAVGSDAFVFSSALEGERFSLADPYSRLYRYSAGHWACVEVASAISDLLVLRSPMTTREGLVVLGEEGGVWFVGPRTRAEQIPNAGSARFAGGLTVLRQHGGHFFAAGLGGQFYRRQQGSWQHDDVGMLDFEPPFPRKRPVDVGQAADILDVATLDDGEQYACGSVATARPALFWRPAAKGAWEWLGSGVDNPVYDYMIFTGILAEAPNRIWLTTNLGVLFEGSADRGFAVATDVARSRSPNGLRDNAARLNRPVLYRGAVHAGSNMGPFRLRDDGSWDQLPSLPNQDFSTSGKAQFATGRIEVSGQTLWSFRSKNTARYDGTAWERIPLPPVNRK